MVCQLLESLKFWPQSELVSSQWVNEHLQDNNVRIVEVIYDAKNRQHSQYSTRSICFRLE